MFALEAFHRSRQEVIPTSNIPNSKEDTTIVWIKRVLSEDSTRRWTLWLIDSSSWPHGFEQSLKDLRNKRLIFERYTRSLLKSYDKTQIELCYIPWLTSRYEDSRMIFK